MAQSPHGFYYSSHYARAYAEANASQWPGQGASGHHYNAHSSSTSSSNVTAFTPAWPDTAVYQGRQSAAPLLSHGSWYEPGNVRCTHEGCTFVGSKKSVETHRMDRHLIYPPGWNSRKQSETWDADPSLKTGCVASLCLVKSILLYPAIS